MCSCAHVTNVTVFRHLLPPPYSWASLVMSRMKNMNHFGEEAVLFISVINQLDAHNFCFTINLFHASTCFEHMCSSSGGQNCTHHTYRCDDTRGCVMHTYSCDDTRGCVIQFWPPDDEHMCSKHVEAWNKHIVKQKFCSSSWLITEINIPRCTVSKTLKKKKQCCDGLRCIHPRELQKTTEVLSHH